MITDIRQADLWVPPMGEIAEATRAGLETNYQEVDVSIASCADLRDLGCASPGLRGRPFLVEIGGEPLVHNPSYRDEASFDLPEIMGACGRPRGNILGAGFPSLVATGGKCGELIPCLQLAGRNLSKIARVGARKQCLVEDYPSMLHGGLGNLYVSDSVPGDVIRVEVRVRTGEEASLSQAIRSALKPLVAGQEGREIGLGGVFSVLQGRVRAHISPDFECIPFPYYDAEAEKVIRPDFLEFYEGMGPGLTCMSVLWTGDPTGGELNLRPTGEHTHFFSVAGRQEAGHYHGDVTPDSIHCLGYFHPAGQVFRVADIYKKLAASRTAARRDIGKQQP